MKDIAASTTAHPDGKPNRWPDGTPRSWGTGFTHGYDGNWHGYRPGASVAPLARSRRSYESLPSPWRAGHLHRRAA